MNDRTSVYALKEPVFRALTF